MGLEWDSSGTRVGLEWDQSGTRVGPEWDQSGTRVGPEWDSIAHTRSYCTPFVAGSRPGPRSGTPLWDLLYGTPSMQPFLWDSLYSTLFPLLWGSLYGTRFYGTPSMEPLLSHETPLDPLRVAGRAAALGPGLGGLLRAVRQGAVGGL